MLFADERLNFFRPLTGKYREQVVACLRTLYARLYSSLADYSRVVEREQVLEAFQEAITRTPVLEGDEEDTSPVRGERDQANVLLNLLLEHGWLERNFDEVSLSSTYGFSRIGRLFTQPMEEIAGGTFRTRHRNMRNTCSALRAFNDKHEVYDLLDAYEYSERIVSDFSDVIAELEARKRQLVRELEAQELVRRASEEFFDFMEKRFKPDVALRFTEDSVVKYQEELDGQLRRARAQRRETKAAVEQELRRLAPELVKNPRVSVYMTLLEQIESRLHSAAELMLPALRQSLHGFTRRADVLLRQLSFTQASQHALLEAMGELAPLEEEAQDRLLLAAAEHLPVLDMGFVDPDSLRLHSHERRRKVSTRAESPAEEDIEARRRLFVEQALERAFAIHNRQLYDYVVAALAGGHEIHTAALPMRDARELLHAAHVIEIGSASWSSGHRFEVLETHRQVSNTLFASMDDFIVRVVET